LPRKHPDSRVGYLTVPIAHSKGWVKRKCHQRQLTSLHPSMVGLTGQKLSKTILGVSVNLGGH